MGIRKRSKIFKNIQKYSKNEWKRLHSTGENIQKYSTFLDADSTFAKATADKFAD